MKRNISNCVEKRPNSLFSLTDNSSSSISSKLRLNIMNQQQVLHNSDQVVLLENLKYYLALPPSLEMKIGS